jgi:propionaldehyde dehydrogenase
MVIEMPYINLKTTMKVTDEKAEVLKAKFGKAIDTAIFVKNAPSYAALGFGGEGYCTFTIASRTGEGLTSASTFTKRRQCTMADSLCVR